MTQGNEPSVRCLCAGRNGSTKLDSKLVLTVALVLFITSGLSVTAQEPELGIDPNHPESRMCQAFRVLPTVQISRLRSSVTG